MTVPMVPRTPYDWQDEDPVGCRGCGRVETREPSGVCEACQAADVLEQLDGAA